ncbi:7579_t:CDS:1, partial [Dentiscutata heterogama]
MSAISTGMSLGSLGSSSLLANWVSLIMPQTCSNCMVVSILPKLM